MVQPHYYAMRLIAAVLFLLAIAACGRATTTQIGAPTAIEVTQPPLPTHQPAAPAPGMTSTAQPVPPTAAVEATPAPAPTQPPASPTPESAPTAGATGPTPVAQGTIVLLSGGKRIELISVDGSVQALSIPALASAHAHLVGPIASDGAWIVGVQYRDPLYGHREYPEEDMFLYQITTGQERIITQLGVHISNLVFSPDSRSLLFNTQDWDSGTWQVNALDLASGATRVLLQGGDRDMWMYVPFAWTPRGVFATQYPVSTADAPNTGGIYLIDPKHGSVQTIRPADQPMINYAVSSDGDLLAVTQGLVSLGIEDSSAISSSLVLLDLRSGERKVLEPEQPGIFNVLSWSPDSSKLLYCHWKAQDVMCTITSPRSGELLRLRPFQRLGYPFAWRDNNTLLVSTLAENRHQLYGLPISSVDALQAQEILSRDLAETEIVSQVIYVGR